MLVLSRKRNQVIVIGDDGNPITVKVIEIRGNKVRLGVVAGDGVPIDRGEVRLRKQVDGLQAQRTEAA